MTGRFPTNDTPSRWASTPLIVIFTINLGWVIVTEAALGFLGLGLPPDVATWGGMFSWEGRRYMETEPSKETAWKAFYLAQEFTPDLFVGLGGGSCMDVGKVAWLLFEHPDLADLPLSESVQETRNTWYPM